MNPSSVLFVTDLDGTLLQSDETISPYSKKILNQLAHDGAMITAATGRSGATADPLFQGIHFNLPLITMNGCALFSMQNKTFSQCHTIPYDVSKEILSAFRHYQINCLTYTIREQHLSVYYDDLRNPAERTFYEQRKKLPLKKYKQEDLPYGQDVIYFSSIQSVNAIIPLKHNLEAAPFASEINIICYDDVYHTGYCFFEIYAKTASKKNAVLSLAKQYQIQTIIAFGDNLNDRSMMEAADYCFAVENAAKPILEIADEVIGNHNENAVAKKIAEIFYHNKS